MLRISPKLSITGGISFDSLRYPDNFRSPPINGKQSNFERLSPKLGLVLEPWRGATLRAAYTEAVAGTSFDESIRLEPTQVAGFLQSYRSLASESVLGAVAGNKFKLWGLSFEQKLPTHTYLGVEFGIRNQNLDRTIGVFERIERFDLTTFDYAQLGIVPSSITARDRYREDILSATVNQLIGGRWSLGAHYRYTRSKLRGQLDGYGAAIERGGFAIPLLGLIDTAEHENVSTLHELRLIALYNHPSGFFARAEGNWYRQENERSVTVSDIDPADPNFITSVPLRKQNERLAGEDFWQFNVYAGWRFHRNQCEVSCGLLNIAGEDYRLNPLNPYEELARDRTVVVRCRLSF